MNINDLVNMGNVTLNVDPMDLKVFALYLIEKAKEWALEDAEENAKHSHSTVLLATSEVMQRLKVGRTTLNRWNHNGFLCPVKIGKFTRYRLCDVEKVEEGQ